MMPHRAQNLDDPRFQEVKEGKSDLFRTWHRAVDAPPRRWRDSHCSPGNPAAATGTGCGDDLADRWPDASQGLAFWLGRRGNCAGLEQPLEEPEDEEEAEILGSEENAERADHQSAQPGGAERNPFAGR